MSKFCSNFFLISCKKYSEFASRDLDGDSLTKSEERKMNLHHFFCNFCRRFTKQIRVIDESASLCFKNDSESCCEKLSTECKDKIKEILDNS